MNKLVRITCCVAIVVVACWAGASGSTIYTTRAAWTSHVTGITTWDFNNLQGNLYQTLTLGNVTFDVPGYPDSGALWVSTSGSYAPIDIALVGNHYMTTVQGTFATAVGAVGADVANLSVNDTIAINVEINGTWYLWSVPYTYPTPFFWGIVAGAGESIDAITFSPTTSNWVGIDNFAYGSNIPEPGTMVMLGTGLVGLAGVLRRKLRM